MYKSWLIRASAHEIFGWTQEIRIYKQYYTGLQITSENSVSINSF